MQRMSKTFTIIGNSKLALGLRILGCFLYIYVWPPLLGLDSDAKAVSILSNKKESKRKSLRLFTWIHISFHLSI